MQPKYADDIVPQRNLILYACYFKCPFCGREWDRGGTKEGFVKSGANNHVFACWEIVLFQKGYILGAYGESGKGRMVTPIAECPFRQRATRQIKALIRTRIRDGYSPKAPI